MRGNRLTVDVSPLGKCFPSVGERQIEEVADERKALGTRRERCRQPLCRQLAVYEKGEAGDGDCKKESVTAVHGSR